jgi:hypothetical protein
MSTLMFDSRFKSMQLVTTYLAPENVTPIVVEYDEKLLLLLTKKYKLLMLVSVEEIQYQVNIEIYFTPQ